MLIGSGEADLSEAGGPHRQDDGQAEPAEEAGCPHFQDGGEADSFEEAGPRPGQGESDFVIVWISLPYIVFCAERNLLRGLQSRSQCCRGGAEQ